MSRPPRRQLRRRRRRQEPPAPDAYELLTLLAELRGSPEARDVWRLLTDPFWSAGSWRDVDPLLRMIQAMGDAGLFTDEERFFLIGNLGDAVVPSRASEDPRFPEVEREMQRVRDEHGLTEDEDWLLPEAPEGYRALNDEWGRIADREMARWFRELGEQEMAWLLLNDRGEFEARWDAGRRELLGIGEGDLGA